MAIAWRLARRGLSVRVLERARCGREATWAAAGMLAADAEMEYEEPELHRFSVESRELWPGFAAELEEATGRDVDYRVDETLMVAEDRDAREALRRRYEFLAEEDVEVEWLTGSEARDLEPFLSPEVRAAVRAPSDHQVDNRKLVDALAEAVDREGGHVEEQTPVRALRGDPDREGVRAITDETTYRAEWGIVAAGAWSGRLDGLPDPSPPIRPVRGQVIELDLEPPFGLSHVVRGSEAYLVPKGEDRLMIGATSEEQGFDRAVTAGALYRLLEGGRRAVRGIDELPVRDLVVGFRPASRDHRPVIGPSGTRRIVYASGHYRHGILLAPITAREIERFIVEGERSRWLSHFSPNRFSAAHAE